jgi:hypothetical protein
MSTAVLSLDPSALTSLEATRTYVKGAINRDQNDDVLIPLINAFSETIRDITGREFGRTPAEDSDPPFERVFSYDGSGFLSLSPFELRTLGGDDYGGLGVVSASYPTSSGSTTIVPRYVLGGESDEGTMFWLEFPRFGYAYQTPRWGHTVSVSGYWGLADVPRRVELAIWMSVLERVRNPATFAGQSIGDYSFSESPDVSARGIPQTAWDLLETLGRRAPVV